MLHGSFMYNAYAAFLLRIQAQIEKYFYKNLENYPPICYTTPIVVGQTRPESAEADRLEDLDTYSYYKNDSHEGCCCPSEDGCNGLFF